MNAAVSHCNCVRLYGICPDPAALITGELHSCSDWPACDGSPRVPLCRPRARKSWSKGLLQ